MRTRPFFIVTLCYVAGVITASLWPLPPLGLFVISFCIAALAAGLCFWRQSMTDDSPDCCQNSESSPESAAMTPKSPTGFLPFKPRLLIRTTPSGLDRALQGILGLLLFLTGATNITWRTEIIPPHDLRLLADDKDQAVGLRGVLRDSPTFRMLERNQDIEWRSLAVLEVHSWKKQGSWEPAAGSVALSSAGKIDDTIAAGAPLEVQGVLRPPAGAAAEGLFDYRSYLKWQGIHHELKVQGPEDWRLLDPRAQENRVQVPVSDRFCRWARDILGRGLPEEDEVLRLIWAMALGWKTGMTREVARPFMETGTMHIFAISGLHVALITGILVSLLRVLQVPRSACGIVVIPLIWFYTAATGWQSSAIRSSVMMTVVIVGWTLKRPGDLLNSLLAAGFLLLLWEPRQLFQASFQLSFFVVLSLALAAPVINHFRHSLLEPDPLRPRALIPAWQRWLKGPSHALVASFLTSLAAWLGSLPLVAYYFHLFTPISLAVNLIAVPLSSLALMCHLGSLICGDWLPWVTELFNHSGWLWMKMMLAVCRWASELPGACWHVRSPSWLEFILYYTMLIAIFTARSLSAWSRRWLAGILAVLTAFCAMMRLWESRGSCLTVLHLNGGDAIVFDAPGTANDLLVDSGNAFGAEYIVGPFLQSLGWNRIPTLVVTHGDVNHAGGVQPLSQIFKVDKLCASSVPQRSPVYRRLFQAMPSKSWILQPVHQSDTLGPWTVLHPKPQDRFRQADDAAVVLRGILHGHRILLLSDLGRQGQELLMNRESDLRSDIVVASLPSQGEPLADPLLDRIQPRLILLTTSDRKPAEMASAALRSRLAKRHIPVLCTANQGTVRFRLDKDCWKTEGMGEMPP